MLFSLHSNVMRSQQLIFLIPVRYRETAQLRSIYGQEIRFEAVEISN